VRAGTRAILRGPAAQRGGDLAGVEEHGLDVALASGDSPEWVEHGDRDAEIARLELGPLAGTVTAIAILFIVVIAMTLYIIGNLLMIPIMRAAGLGVALSISTIAQLCLANVVAFTFFQERPAPMQIAGLVLGLISLALIMLPAGQK